MLGLGSQATTTVLPPLVPETHSSLQATNAVGVSVVLTYSPVASSWVEKVRVESIWFGHLLQMVANTADLQCTGDECYSLTQRHNGGCTS